ncbi:MULTISPECIES: universal stress protein [unclassified Fusibacter]|uniref:universal stress protein n=1 Tax=unclassified Fusibacter TaxID=2624464 RepID=UPI0010111746|nr:MULTISPECIES: universal stress protein [unclassified Fusibacter]MCK8059936.1 universal stress protein [Fusibacter sp. A2]NPE22078.1 universal stress protein [Fusibacter sp. A1]RXV60857.1 universal stress protein UspA [Fusibacter sp. A1]
MRSKTKVMVCVTQQKSCERLLAHAAELARHDHDEIYMVHVVKENWRYFGKMKESDALEYLFDISKDYNASVNVLKSKDIDASLADFAQKLNVDYIVMGESLEVTKQQNMIHRLQNITKKNVKFEIVKISDEGDQAS